MDNRSALAPWIRRFLMEYLIGERNLARNTQRSYRDAVRLLVVFTAAKVHKKVDELLILDIDADMLRAFLRHIEERRKCSVSSRNQRLAAIHALGIFIAERCPEYLDWCAQLRTVKAKRSAPRPVCYLEKPEIDADFLNLHNGEVAHTLILGATGSGKSYLASFILQNAQKYAPLTYIFDIGGSFESLTHIFGGTYLNVGQESRDFTINPFSLKPTKENLQFLFSLFRVLIEGNSQRYRLDFKEERRLWEAIERIYMLEPEQRTISNLANIIGELKERLHRWTRAGQYGFVFDNVEDTLSFSRFETFNFNGWGDAPDVLEPLLFYVLHRASNEITDPGKLGTFKIFLMDEAWLFIRNETIRQYIVQAQKTWRKHNAAMILSTQSIKELEESGMLQIVAESCPTKIFLANPEMDCKVYHEAFHLNDTELELIAGLVPPGQMLIRKAQSSKKVHLNVDSVSHWMATNNARDNLKSEPATHMRTHSRLLESANISRGSESPTAYGVSLRIILSSLVRSLESINRRKHATHIARSRSCHHHDFHCPGTGCIGTNCSVPCTRHSPDSREAQIHNAH
jgi:hypothetical protein